MTVSNQPVTVAILITAETCASTALGLFEMLRSAGSPWQLNPRAANGQSSVGTGRFSPYLVGESSGAVRVAHNIVVHASMSRHDAEDADIVIVPEMLLARGGALPVSFSGWHGWLNARYAGGAVMASCSSGSALLADSGLLDGVKANTHWALAGGMNKRFPGVAFEAEESVLVAGLNKRFVMAGAGTAWQDLVLHLIARFMSVDDAMRTARVEFIQWHDIPQRAWSDHSDLPETADAPIARAISWLGEHFDESAPVGAAVQQAGLAERTFTRRFHLATGVSPLEFVHRLRLARARRVLETTALNVQAVARQLGYEDPSFFSRLFKREVALTPAQYRKQFGALRKSLDEVSRLASPS